MTRYALLLILFLIAPYSYSQLITDYLLHADSSWSMDTQTSTWHRYRCFNYLHQPNGDYKQVTGDLNTLLGNPVGHAYTYNTDRQLASIAIIDTATDGTPFIATKYSYIYNSNQLLSEIILQEIDGFTLKNRFRAVYSYNAFDKMDTLWHGYYTHLNSWAMAINHTFTYNAQQQLISETTYELGPTQLDTISRHEYQYYPNHNIAQIQQYHYNNGSWTSSYRYAFDSLYQSYSVYVSPQAPHPYYRYSFDRDAHQRVLKESVYKQQNGQLALLYESRYTYEANEGNFIEPPALQPQLNHQFNERDHLPQNWGIKMISQYNAAGDLSGRRKRLWQKWDPVGVLRISSAEVSLFPNPANTHIQLKGAESDAQIQVFDLQGKCVLHTQNSSRSQIHIGHLPAGVYVLLIQQSSQEYSYTFIKE